MSGEVRSTLNLTKINIDTFDTDEVGSFKMHVITDREFIVIPWKGVGSVDRSKQNCSYPNANVQFQLPGLKLCSQRSKNKLAFTNLYFSLVRVSVRVASYRTISLLQ